MVKFCSKCGAQAVEETSLFCALCGAQLVADIPDDNHPYADDIHLCSDEPHLLSGSSRWVPAQKLDRPWEEEIHAF